MYYPAQSPYSMPVVSPRRRSSIAPPLSPVFANGSGGGIDGYRPRASSLAPDQPDNYAPPHAPQQRQSILDPAAGLAPPQMDVAVRNQKRLYGLQNEQEYRQQRFARNSLQTEAGKRADAIGKDVYNQTLHAPPAQAAVAPAPPLAPPPPPAAGGFTAQAQQFNPALAQSVPSIAPPQARAQAAPAPMSVAPPMRRESLNGYNSQSTNPITGGQVISMRTEQAGTPPIAPPQYAAAEMQRQQNFATYQGRGITPPGSGILTPPMTPQQANGTPTQYGQTVTRELARGTENPQRLAAEQAARAARLHEQAQFDTPEQQRQTNNTLAGQAIDANAGYLQGRLENETTRAQALATAADARANVAPSQSNLNEAKAGDLAGKATTYAPHNERTTAQAEKAKADAKSNTVKAAAAKTNAERTRQATPGTGNRDPEMQSLAKIKAYREARMLDQADALEAEHNKLYGGQAPTTQPTTAAQPTTQPSPAVAAKNYKDGDVQDFGGHKYQRANGHWQLMQ